MPRAAGLWYEEHGPADAPPLVLSSGLGGGGGYWTPNLPALAERFRVILYDHRGTGRSDGTLPRTLSMDDFARDMHQLLDALDIGRAHVMGHAAGGVAALTLARRAPERVGQVVVVNGWLFADPHFLRCFDARLALLRHSGVEAFLRAQPIFLYPAAWISAHDAQLRAELAPQLAGFPGKNTLEKRIAALAAFDAREWIGTLDHDVLALCAADDMLVPWTCSDLLAQANPKIVRRDMAYGGHACNVTMPDEFNRIVLEFLES